jgi:hypothetical protein
VIRPKLVFLPAEGGARQKLMVRAAWFALLETREKCGTLRLGGARELKHQLSRTRMRSMFATRPTSGDRVVRWDIEAPEKKGASASWRETLLCAGPTFSANGILLVFDSLGSRDSGGLFKIEQVSRKIQRSSAMAFWHSKSITGRAISLARGGSCYESAETSPLSR